MKEHLQQVGFEWNYSHEELLPGELPGELSQQYVLVKSKIPTPNQMSQIDKEVELKRDIDVKNKVSGERMNVVRIEDEESSSSSSMSLYNIKSHGKDSEVSSRQNPTLVENVPKKPEEVHSSLTTDKNQSKRHSQVQQEEEDPSSYNIDEIFEAFTFNLYKREVSRKRIKNEKQDDGTLK